MFKGVKGIIALTAGAILVVTVSYAGYVSVRAPAKPADTTVAAGASCCLISPADRPQRITLDPKRFTGPVREAYEIAEKDPALLAQLHCYCGCDKTDGHKNLLDCFRDSHGSSCAICVGEARDAEAMANRGTPIEQILDALRARYANAHGG